MPANLTPAYLAAEARFRAARTTEEKLAALDEMYATIPKHKGTEKLRAGIKRRISKLREGERQAGRGEAPIVREGVGLVVFVGPEGSGKSSLLERLTGADRAAGKLVSGVIECQGEMIQLADTPAAFPERLEDEIAEVVREADAVAVVLDLAEDSLLEQFEDIREALGHGRIALVGHNSPERDYPAGIVVKPALVVGAKLDLAHASENLESLRELCGDEYMIWPVSVKSGDGVEELRDGLCEVLEGEPGGL